MPASRYMLPIGTQARSYTRSAFGTLANFFVLDDRQFRSHEVCPRPGRGGSNSVDPMQCAELADPKRTMLGGAQEQWLGAALAGSRARWNIIAQQTRMAPVDEQARPGPRACAHSRDG